MSDQDAFERTLAAIHDAMLDDTRWPAASALIDEACGLTGNSLLIREGPEDDVRLFCVGTYRRGKRREDLARDYIENYHRTDERVPRFRQLPHGRLVHIRSLYTAEELKTSPAYNEMLRRAGMQDSLNARLDGPDGSHIAWSPDNPVDANGWGSSRTAMVAALLPHIRQFVRVRHALVRAEAQNTTVTALLDNPRIGVVHLDRRGRIMAANDRARSVLGHGDGLSDRNGMLRARAAADQVRLDRLVGDALPVPGATPVSGAMLLHRSPVLPPFAVHVKPMGVPQPDYGARHVAALMLIVEPGRRHRVDPNLVARTLKLTPAETRVAVWLAEGRSVRDMADATGHSEGTMYWHLKKIYRKHSISRQADLAQFVLSLAELG